MSDNTTNKSTNDIRVSNNQAQTNNQDNTSNTSTQASVVPNDIAYASQNVKDPKLDIRMQMNHNDEVQEQSEAAPEQNKDTDIVRYDENNNKTFNWADATMNGGVTARGASKAGLTSSFFLPEDKDIKKQLEEKGIDEKYHSDLIQKIKNDYNQLKNGTYSGGNIKEGFKPKTQMYDRLLGKSYVQQIEDDLFFTHKWGSSGSIKSANIYSYLDDEFKYVKNSTTGKLEKQKLTTWNRIWNPELIVEPNIDENGVPTGGFFITEMEDGEFRTGKTMLPAWNNPEVWGMDWYDAPAAFISGVVPKTLETVGSLFEMFHNIPLVGTEAFEDSNALTKFMGLAKTSMGLFGPSLVGMAYEKAYQDQKGLDPISNGLDHFIRFSQRLQWKPSDSIVEGGFTGSSNSFIYGLSQGLGEFLPQVGMAMATGGSSAIATIGTKSAMSMGRQMLVSQAVKSSTKKTVRSGIEALAKKSAGKALTGVEQAAIKSYDKVISKYAGEKLFEKVASESVQKAMKSGFKDSMNKYAMVGTAQAMSGNYNEMLANGISQQDAAAMAVAMSPIVYLTERVVGTKWLEGKLGIASLDKAIAGNLKKHFGEVTTGTQKALKETIGTTAKNNPTKMKSWKGIKDTMKRYGMNARKKMADSMGKSVKNIGKDIGNSLKGNTSAPAKSGFAKMLGIPINALDKMEDAYDAIKFTKGYFNPASITKAALSEGIQEVMEDFTYISGYYLHDNILAKEGAKKGDGAMGYFSWSRDVMSSDTAHQLTESFIGGAAIGGFASGVMRQRGNKYSDDILNVDAAINGETEKVAEKVFETWRNEPNRFGSTEHAPDLQVRKKNGKDKVWATASNDYSQYGIKKGQELKSEADMNYYNYLDDLFLTKRMYEETGLNREALKRFAGAHSLLFEGTHAMKIMRTLKDKNIEIDEQLKDKSLPAEEVKKLTQEKKVNEATIVEAEKRYKYLIQDEVASINEDRITLNKNIKELRDTKSEDLADPTSEASIRLIEYERQLNELNRSLKKIDKKKSKGYSRGYKDNLKNSVATLMLANEYAVNEMMQDSDFKKKYKGDVNEIDPKDLDDFVKLRSKWMENYNGTNFYDDATSTYQQMVKSAYLERASHHAIVKKAKLDLEKGEYDGELANLTDQMTQIEDKLGNISSMVSESKDKSLKDNIVADEFSAYQRNILSEDLLSFISNMAEFAKKYRAKDEIMEVMQSFQKQLDAVANTLNVDKSWVSRNQMTAVMRKFIWKETQDGEGFYAPENVKAKQDISKGTNLLNIVNVLNKNTDATKKAAKDTISKLEGYKESEKYVNSNLQSNINEMYKKGAQPFIDSLDSISKADSWEEQDLLSLESQTNRAIKYIDEIENSVKVRAFTVAPMQATEDDKYLDHLADVPMDVATAKTIIDDLETQRKELKEHLELIRSKLGSRSNYFKKVQHSELVMKRNFLTGLLENETVKNLNIPGFDDMKSSFEQIEIPLLNLDSEEYTDEDMKKINEADKTINSIYDTLAANSNLFNNKKVLKEILKGVFYDSADIENGEYISYMEDTAYSLFDKNEMWFKLASLTKDDSYGEYSSYDGRIKYHYKHFVNNLVMIASGNKISDLANQRLSLYPRIEMYSSIEQINAENEVLSYLNGGAEIFDMIMNPEYGIEKDFFPKDTNSRDVMLAKYHKGFVALNGDAQTGKSVQLVPQTILLQEQINPKDKYVLVAHSGETLSNFNLVTENLKRINPSLEGKIEVRSHKELLEKGLQENLDNSLIVIDEATLLNDKQIKDLEASYTKNTANKILLVGDESQMTQFLGKNANAENTIFSSGFVTSPISKKYATNNPMLAQLMNAARSSVAGGGAFNEKYPKAWSEVTEDGRKGIEYFSTVKDIAVKFIERQRNGQDNDAALVFLSKKHYEDFLKNNSDIADDLKSFEETIFFLGEDSEIPNEDSKSIQGGRRNQIYNMFDGSMDMFNDYSDISSNLKRLSRNAIYTILSRSRDYIATIGDPEYKETERPNNFVANAEPINNDGVVDYLKDVMNADGSSSFNYGKGGKGSQISNQEDLSEIARETIDELFGTQSGIESIDDSAKDASGIGVYRVKFTNGDTKEFRHNTSVVGVTSKNLSEMFKDNLTKEQQRTLDEMNNLETRGLQGNIVDALWRDVLNSENTSFINKDGTLNIDALWEKHSNDARNNIHKLVEDPKTGKIERTDLNVSMWPNKDTFEMFVNLLYDYRQKLESEYYIITDKILLYHEGVSIAGVPDAILVHKDSGAVKILDLKTKYIGSYVDKDGNLKYDKLTRPYYTYKDDKGNTVELTDHDKYTYQVNAYRELLQEMLNKNIPIDMEINVVITSSPFSYKSGLPKIGRPTDETGKGDGEIISHPIKPVKTNIGAAIEKYNKDNLLVEQTIPSHTFRDGTIINTGDQVFPLRDDGYVHDVNRIFIQNKNVYFELIGNKKSFIIDEKTFNENYFAMSEEFNFMNTESVLSESSSHIYSAKLFSESKGGIIYGNSESIPINKGILKKIKINTVEELQLIKNIKAKMVKNYNTEMVWRKKFTVTGDSFNGQELKSGIFGRIKLRANEKLINKLSNSLNDFTQAEQDILKKIINSNEAENIVNEVFGNLITFTLPRVYNSSIQTENKYVPIVITKLSDVQDAIDSIENSNIQIEGDVKTNEDIRAIKDYNIALVKLYGHALLESEKNNQDEVVLKRKMANVPAKRRTVVFYGKKPRTLKTVIKEAELKGYKFKMSIDRDSVKPQVGKNGIEIRFRADFNFNGDPNTNGKLDVYSPKFDSKSAEAKGIKEFVTKELDEFIRISEEIIDQDDFSVLKSQNGSDIVSNLIKNYSKIFTDKSKIAGIKTPDGKKLSDIIFIDSDTGYPAFTQITRNKTKDGYKVKYNLSLKQEFENRVSFAKFMKREINKKIPSKMFKNTSKNKVYLPILFNDKDIMDKLLTNVSQVNRPSSYYNLVGVKYDTVLSEIKKFQKGGTSTTSKTPKKQSKNPLSRKRSSRGPKFNRMIKSTRKGKLVDLSATEQEAKDIINRILGVGYDAKWTDFETDLRDDDIALWGAMINGRIKLRKNKRGMVNRVAVRHEIFHVIDEYYLAKDTQDRLYQLVKEAVPGFDENSDINDIKEWLADWYGLHGSKYGDIEVERIDEKYLSKFGLLLEGVNDRYIDLQKELASVLQDIERGVYADQMDEVSNIDRVQTLARKMALFDSRKINKIRKTIQNIKKGVDNVEDTRKGSILTNIGNPILEDSIFVRLRDVFNDDKQIINAAKSLSILIFRKSGFGGGDSVLADVIRETGNPSKTGENHELAEFDFELEGFDPSTVKASDLHKLTDDEYDSYIIHHILNDWMVSKGLLSILFPDYSFVDGRLRGKTASTVADKNSNPSLNTSSTINWINETVPLVEEGVIDGADNILYNEFIYRHEVNNIMQQANEKVVASLSAGNSYTLEQYITTVRDQLEQMRPHDGSRRDVSIYSIIKHFFDGLQDGDYINDIEIDPEDIGPSLVENVSDRSTPLSRDISDMMISYFTNYRNIVKSYNLSQRVDYENNPSTSRLNIDDINQYKQVIQDGITKELFVNGRINPNIEGSYKKDLEWKSKKQRIKEGTEDEHKGMVEHTGNSLRIGFEEVLSYNSEKQTYEFNDFSLKSFKDVKNVTGLSALGNKMYYFFADNTLPYSDNQIADVSKIRGANLLNPLELFANIAGNFAEIIQLNVNVGNMIDTVTAKFDDKYGRKWPDNKNIVKTFNSEIENSIKDILKNQSSALKTFLKNIGFNENHIEGSFSLSNGTEEIISVNDVKMIKPQDLFSYIEVLAETMFNNLDLGRTPFAYIGGKKFPVLTIMNNLLNTFPNALPATQGSPTLINTSDERANNDLKILGDNLNDHDSIAFNIKGDTALSNNIFMSDKVYNKELNKWENKRNNLLANVTEIDKLPILTGPYTATENMNRRDNALSMFSVWIDSISKGPKTQMRLPIGFTSTDYYANIEFFENIINVTRDYENNIIDVDVNLNKLKPLFVRNAQMYEKIMRNSFNRLKGFFSSDKMKGFLKNNSGLEKIFTKDFDINNKDIDSLKDVSINISEEMADAIKNSGLIASSDYKISRDDKGNFILEFGNEITNPVPESDFYTRKNISTLLKNPTIKVITDLAENYIKFNNNMIGQLIDSNTFGIMKFWKKSVPKGYKATSRFSATKGKSTIYNPIFTAFALSQLAVTPSMNTLIAGTEAQFEDIIDYNKRFNTNNTPVQRIFEGIDNGLGNQFDLYIYKSKLTSQKIKDEMETVPTNDGGAYGFVPFQILLNNSMGDTHNKIKKGVLKPLSVGTNFVNSRNLIVKYAIDFHDDHLLANNPLLMTVQKNITRLWNKKVKDTLLGMGLSPAIVNALDLNTMVDNYIKSDESYYSSMTNMMNDITNTDSEIYTEDYLGKGNNIPIELKGKIKDAFINNIPMGMIPEDSIKSGARFISNEDPSQVIDVNNFTPNTIKTSNYGLINDYNHVIDKNSLVTAPNQMFGHIADAAKVNDIMNALAELVSINMAEFYTDLGVSDNPDKWTPKEVNKFRSYLRNLGIQNASTNEGNIGLMDILLKNGSIDTIQIARKLEQYQVSRFNKMMQPKFHGSRMIQSSSEYLRFYTDTRTGERYSYSTMNDLFTKKDIDKHFREDRFSHMHIQKDESGKNPVHKDADVASSYMYASVFGINKGEQPEHGFMIKVDGVNDIINFESILDKHHGDTEAIKNAIKEKLESLNAQGKKIIDNNSPFARVQRRFTKEEDIMLLDDDMYQSLAEYMNNYYDSLRVVLARVPFDSLALGLVGRIRQFVWNNGSVVYVNPKDNIRTGGDYDIDELSVYHLGFKNAFDRNEGDIKESNLNKILQNILDFYSDTNYENEIYNTTGVEAIKKGIEDAKKKIKKVNEKAWYETDSRMFHSPMGMNNMKAHVVTGDNAIDVYAAGASAFAYLIQTNRTFANENIDDEDVIKRVGNISGLLQAALDNEKVLLLGEFNIPASAMNILFGLATMGYSYEQIYGIVNSRIAQDLFKSIEKGEDLLESKRYLPLLVGSYIKTAHSWKAEAIDYFSNPLPYKLGDKVQDNIDSNLKKILDYEAFINEKPENELSDVELKKRKVKEELLLKKYRSGLKYFRKLTTSLLDDLVKYRKLKREAKTDEERYDIQVIINSINDVVQNARSIGFHDMNIESLELIKEASIQSEALRRLGRVITLRNGMKSKHSEMVLQFRELERIFGSSVDDLFNNKSNLTVEQKVEFSLERNNQYRGLNENEKKIMKDVETRVQKAIDVRSITKEQPYFASMVSAFNRHYKSMKKSFFVNSQAVEDIELSYQSEQNRYGSQYENQVSLFGDFASEVLISEFFNEEMKSDINIALPIGEYAPIDKSNKEWGNRYTSGKGKMAKINVSTSEGRRLFVKQFPSLIKEMQDLFVSEPSFFELRTFFNSIGIKLNDKDIDILAESTFFDNIKVTGYDGFEHIALNPNVNTSDAAILEVSMNFKKLPKKLRNYFEIYNMLKNKGQYKQRGLSEVITNDINSKMGAYYSAERLDILSSKMTDNKKRNDIHNYLGLRKGLRRPFSHKKLAYDPFRYATVLKKYGLFKSYRPAMIPGVRNDSGKLIHISNVSLFHETVYNLDDDTNTLQGGEVIKIPANRDVEFFEKLIKENKTLELKFGKPVGYKPTGTGNIYYISDHGYIIDLDKPQSNIVELTRNSETTYEEIARETAERYSTLLSHLPTSNKRVNELMIKNQDFESIFITYDNLSIAMNESQYGTKMYDEFISRKFTAGNGNIGYYYVEVIPFEEEMTNKEIKRKLSRRGISDKDFLTALGIDKMPLAKRVAYTEWLNDPSNKTTRYFLEIKLGDEVSADSWQMDNIIDLEDHLKNNKNDSKSCKK